MHAWIALSFVVGWTALQIPITVLLHTTCPDLHVEYKTYYNALDPSLRFPSWQHDGGVYKEYASLEETLGMMKCSHVHPTKGNKERIRDSSEDDEDPPTREEEWLMKQGMCFRSMKWCLDQFYKRTEALFRSMEVSLVETKYALFDHHPRFEPRDTLSKPSTGTLSSPPLAQSASATPPPTKVASATPPPTKVASATPPPTKVASATQLLASTNATDPSSPQCDVKAWVRIRDTSTGHWVDLNHGFVQALRLTLAHMEGDMVDRLGMCSYTQPWRIDFLVGCQAVMLVVCWGWARKYPIVRPSHGPQWSPFVIFGLLLLLTLVTVVVVSAVGWKAQNAWDMASTLREVQWRDLVCSTVSDHASDPCEIHLESPRPLDDIQLYFSTWALAATELPDFVGANVALTSSIYSVMGTFLLMMCIWCANPDPEDSTTETETLIDDGTPGLKRSDDSSFVDKKSHALNTLGLKTILAQSAPGPEEAKATDEEASILRVPPPSPAQAWIGVPPPSPESLVAVPPPSLAQAPVALPGPPSMPNGVPDDAALLAMLDA
jgi:hypothetical protein